MQRCELNDLQRKSPEDLWKEDLAVFIEELDVSFVLVDIFITFLRANQTGVAVFKGRLCILL